MSTKELGEPIMEFAPGQASLLFPSGFRASNPNTPDPAFFHDLNLDQILDDVERRFQNKPLRGFYLDGPHDLETISYRHEVFHELERLDIQSVARTFLSDHLLVTTDLTQSDQCRHPAQKQAWLVDATFDYVGAVQRLFEGLKNATPRSRGLKAYFAELGDYVNSEDFRLLSSEVIDLKAQLSSINYEIHILGNTVTVQRSQNAVDLNDKVTSAFERFRSASAADHSLELRPHFEASQVEFQILDSVIRLWPEIFEQLAGFTKRWTNFRHAIIQNLDLELSVYLAYLDHLEKYKQHGLSFCYPEVIDSKSDIFQTEGFDLALTATLALRGEPVVVNDFTLEPPECLIVVTGPNQGGKTTFARAFGQAHYLANLGFPVPGTRARLIHYDHLFTHFEVEEVLTNGRGKLYDDLLRMRSIVTKMTSRSVVILNEIFNSTTVRDALVLAQNILAEVSRQEVVGVCVTFLDELASLNEKVASFASTVVAHDPTQRTFKVVRKPADGLAFALAIAEKYQLTYAQLLGRLPL